MLNQEPRGRTLPLLISLVVVGVLLMTFDVRSQGGGVVGAFRTGTQALVAPLQEATSFVVTPVADLVDSLSDITNLREENIALRGELSEARADLVAVQDQLARLEYLEQLYGLERVGDQIGRTVAGVIGRPNAFDAGLIIDKGTSDGIAVGQPVVDTNGFVVGTIKDVTGGTAIVVPLIAQRQGLTVMINDQVGMLTSQPGTSDLWLEIPDAREPVLAGEKVRTAAISAKFPTGWPIGEVIEDSAPLADVVTTTVDPYVDPDTLRIVVVLAWPPDPVSIIADDTPEPATTTSTTETTSTTTGEDG